MARIGIKKNKDIDFDEKTLYSSASLSSARDIEPHVCGLLCEQQF